MKTVGEMWKSSDRISLFVLLLVVLLVLLLVGLLLADRSLRESMDEQSALDAATSAKIIAQEVESAMARCCSCPIESEIKSRLVATARKLPITGQRVSFRA